MRKYALPLLACFALALSSCATTVSEKDLAAEYFAIAEGYAGVSKYEKAIDFYKKASRSPDFANACDYGLGRMYALSGQWDESCAVFQRLYLKDTSNAFTASAYAFSLASAGQTEKALEIYGAIYLADMEDPRNARNYAEILVLAKEYESALEQISLIRDQFPDTDAVKGLDELEKKVKDALNPPADKGKDGTSGDTPAKDAPTPPEKSGPGAPKSDAIEPAPTASPSSAN